MASKQLERIYVDGFLKTFPQFEVVAEREAPDFILRDEVGLIGLEVVQIFRDSSPAAGSPAKRIEGRRQGMLANLAKRYYAGGGKPVMVTALMRGSSLGDLDRLAKRLRQRRPQEPWAQIRIPLDQATECLYVTALPDQAGQYQSWQCASSAVGWVRRSCETLVLSAIAAKATKLPSYRESADRIALLLVADSTHASGMVSWSSRDVVASPQGFDAVYFYRHPMAAVRMA